MTNEDKYLYSLKSFVVMAKSVRQCQTLYRNLLVVAGKTRLDEDRDAAEVAYARCRRLELNLDTAIDEIMNITESRPTAPDPSPIALTGWLEDEFFYIAMAIVVIVVAYLVLLFDNSALDALLLLLKYGGITVGTIAFGIIGYLGYCTKQLTGEED